MAESTSAMGTTLAKTRQQILEIADAYDAERLLALADLEATLALGLQVPEPDPVDQLRVSYRRTRAVLARLDQHPESLIVYVRTEPGVVYSYTPRKVLRRVLDHALDHLNQLEQWLAWRERGIVPVPADGWAPSTVVFDEDRAPLDADELAAWLWRIDLTSNLLIKRASQLSQEMLDWQPPDGGWTLHTMLQHVATAQVFYTSWLDDPLPDAPAERYARTSQHLRDRIERLRNESVPDDQLYFGPGGSTFTLADLEDQVLEAERALLA